MRGLAFKPSRKAPDMHVHVAYWVDRIERMLRRYLRDRDRVPPGQLVEVTFADIVADDVGTAAGVLEFAGLPATDECLADIAAYMASHPRGKEGRVVYDLEGDFGIGADEMRERFAFYTDEFGIEPETRR
jgi:Sulfotransferase family